MTGGLAAVQARVAELQQLVAPRTPASANTRTPSAAASTAFTDVLAQITGSGAATGAGPDPGAQAVTLAQDYLGVPYVWGGTNPSNGLDCSGLTQLVYKRLGISLPRVSRDQAKSGTEVPSLDQARPGDLVFFGSPVDHVGIYVGDGTMLDAPRAGKSVSVRKVFETPSHIRRVTPQAPAAASMVGLGAMDLAALGRLGGTATGATTGLGGPYADLFSAAGARHGVDPALLSAVARAESSYNPTAVSGAGAQGLMQLMPATARSLGVDPLNPAQAVDGAARLLSGYLHKYGDTALALAAYNAGPGAVSKYGGVPPYTETRNYIRRVTSAWEALR